MLRTVAQIAAAAAAAARGGRASAGAGVVRLFVCAKGRRAGGGSDGESTLNSDWKRAWLEERLANELVMHTLHAFDLVHWVQ